MKIIARFADRAAAYDCERRLQKRLRVISNPLYANRSYGHKATAGGWNVGLPAWNKGKRWSEETLLRIKAAKSVTTEETRLRMAAARKGKLVGESNPSKRAEVREKIRISKLGTKPVSAGWNKGRTGVYSAEVIAEWSKARTGIPNPIVAESNRRRAGIPHRKKGESEEAFALRLAAVQAEILRRHPGGHSHPVTAA